MTPSAPPKLAPRAAPMPAISSSAWKVRTPKFLCLLSSCRMSEAGVIGYAPRNSGSPLWWRGRDQAVGQGQVAGDVPVGALGHRGRGDLVGDDEVLGRLPVVPAGPERRHVRGRYGRLLGELLLQEGQRGLGRPVVEPGQQAERVHVLRALGVLAGDVVALQDLHRLRGQRDLVHLVAVQRAVLQRVGGVADLGQRARGELVGVDDDRAAARDVLEVRLQRRRVHRHQHVRRVAGGEDVVVGEVQLERGHAGQGPGGGPDLGGEVGQRRQVVAERRGLGGEPVTGELHPVAGVAGETDDDPVDLLNLLGHGRTRPVVRSLVTRTSNVTAGKFPRAVVGLLECLTPRNGGEKDVKTGGSPGGARP